MSGSVAVTSPSVPSIHRIFTGKDVHKFSSAHMTVFPDGTKERLHGHNFQVRVAFDLRTTALASLLDFGEVKRALADQCLAWDQRLLLAEKCPCFKLVREDAGELEFVLCEKRYVVPRDEVVLLPLENIVVETLAEAFAHSLLQRLEGLVQPDVVAGMEVTVEESRNQGGSYYWRLSAEK
jgi:6-pyruvoyltetrahydropterin/6-carboxytetrahydropterin synthase